MSDFFMNRTEKKVEYIELIYDLIFVYLMGRNNAILHNISSGFFGVGTYANYILSTLVILQVWSYSTLFINRYGSNRWTDYIFLFINMYLLYYLADGIRSDWSGYYMRYNVAWGLILLNHAFQYFLAMRRTNGCAPWEKKHLRYHMSLLIVQAAVIFISIPVYNATGIPLSWLSLVFGFISSVCIVRVDALSPVNMEHLTERVMLFVVFTFGETVVGLAGYFTESFGINTVYFSLAAFLIVAGLFLSYGYIYDHVIDRERQNMETYYVLLHVVLVVALNNITAAMEFMREIEVSEIAKNIFIVASFLIYYIFLFIIGHYAKEGCKADGRFFAKVIGVSAVFVILMALIYHNSWLSIAVSVMYVYSMFGMIVRRWHNS